ncbi:phage repressor protein C with HTH and peptisase S24 domain [Raoultella sp. BIGb0138]|uniref:phage repressor protein CI n=1 Tax=Raoultella sp. BIGb0138 TaxID=2485115 RepID=UPI001048B4C8|nr:phage repressor protein CI [Raoultella sp. BIGb0138]TCW04005.1 phage repressor protein C with HTH and peptisase S24 domain [Raoultella sp. BIGb0138]HCQ7474545.1 phage repressor protein CI [Klebsiella michiganensis]
MIQVKAGENTGGKEAIHRLMAAYDFKSRQQLCDHLGASKSTMANRYLRDSFPAEWVIQCALETGVSLLWLTTGQGEPGSNIDSEKNINFVNSGKVKLLSDLISPEIDKVTLTGGSLVEAGKAIIDSSLLPSDSSNLLLVNTAGDSYLVDRNQTPPVNGMWLVDIDGIKSIVKLTRLPGNRLVVHQDDSSFECSLDALEVLGKALKIIKSL